MFLVLKGVRTGNINLHHMRFRLKIKTLQLYKNTVAGHLCNHHQRFFFFNGFFNLIQTALKDIQVLGIMPQTTR